MVRRRAGSEARAARARDAAQEVPVRTRLGDGASARGCSDADMLGVAADQGGTGEDASGGMSSRARSRSPARSLGQVAAMRRS